jgi:ABC-type Na+ transport system ATPase subunit NatA
VVFQSVSFAFDEHVILRDVSFEVPRASMRFLLSASGSSKSILLKLILGLIRPDAGRIIVNGHRIDDMPERELLALRGDIGMVFQEDALFDSLTVDENVGYRLYEETDNAHERSALDCEHPLGVNHFACVRKTRVNVFECDMAVLLLDVLGGIAAGEEVKDKFNADPCALDHRLPDQHVRVGDDARSPVHSGAPLR